MWLMMIVCRVKILKRGLKLFMRYDKSKNLEGNYRWDCLWNKKIQKDY